MCMIELPAIEVEGVRGEGVGYLACFTTPSSHSSLLHRSVLTCYPFNNWLPFALPMSPTSPPSLPLCCRPLSSFVSSRPDRKPLIFYTTHLVSISFTRTRKTLTEFIFVFCNPSYATEEMEGLGPRKSSVGVFYRYRYYAFAANKYPAFGTSFTFHR